MRWVAAGAALTALAFVAAVVYSAAREPFSPDVAPRRDVGTDAGWSDYRVTKGMHR